MKFSLLALASVAATAQAALKVRCAGFEEPSAAYNTTLELASKGYDSSVLIFRLADLPHTNIPLGVASEALLDSSATDFTYCSEQRVSAGLCAAEQLHTFTLKQTADVQAQIVNAFVPNGESVHYDVKKSGIYCAAIYQEGTAKLIGAKWYEQHSWGAMSLVRWEYIQTLTTQAAWLFAIVAISVYWCFKFGTLSIATDIAVFCCVKFILVANSLIAYSYYEPASSYHGDFFDVFSYADYFSSLVLINFLLRASAGIFGASNNDKAKLIAFLQSSKKVRILMGVYFFSYFISTCSPAFEDTTGFPSTVYKVSQAVASVGWIPLYICFWKTAKATEKASLDAVFARNFRVSRKLFIWVPVFLSFTSVFTNAVIQYNLTMKDVDIVPSASMESIFAQSLDVAISTNYFFILLKHLPEFSLVTIFSALLYIWRPTLLESYKPVALDLNEETSTDSHMLNEKA